MQLLNSNYDLSLENVNKITPKKLKRTADWILLITMLLNFLATFIDMATPWLEQMPEVENKVWIIWTVSGLSLLFKFITKMIAEKQTDNVTIT